MLVMTDDVVSFQWLARSVTQNKQELLITYDLICDMFSLLTMNADIIF